MRTCPSCGFANADEASRCQQCGRLLAPSEPHTLEPAAAPSLPPPGAAPSVPPPAVSVPPLPAYPPMPPPGAPYPAYPPRPPYLMMTPVPPPPRPLFTSGQKWRRFLGGLGLGLIPAAVGGVALGLTAANPLGLQDPASLLSTGLLATAALYLADLIAMIVCLSITRVRFIGYGLLAALVALPVILVVGCVVAISLPRPA